MTNYRGISFLSISAKVYNEIQFNRIRDHVDPILRIIIIKKKQKQKQKQKTNKKKTTTTTTTTKKTQLDFDQVEVVPSRYPHPAGKDNGRLPRLPTITFIDFKKAFDSIDRKVMFAVLWHYGLWRWSKPSVHCSCRTSTHSKVQLICRREYFWSLWCFYRSPVAPLLFTILVDYLLTKATSDLDSGVKCTLHILATQDDTKQRYWMTWTLPTTLPCWNPQWPGHRPSWPVQHQQQKILSLIDVSKKEYLTANCNPPAFTWSLWWPHDHINHVTDFKISWLQIGISCKWPQTMQGIAWSA